MKYSEIECKARAYLFIKYEKESHLERACLPSHHRPISWVHAWKKNIFK